jgi:hypothetical protein
MNSRRFYVVLRRHVDGGYWNFTLHEGGAAGKIVGGGSCAFLFLAWFAANRMKRAYKRTGHTELTHVVRV